MFVDSTESKMNDPKEDLIKIENKIRELEARIKKLENWKLVHTSMSKEKVIHIRSHLKPKMGCNFLILRSILSGTFPLDTS